MKDVLYIVVPCYNEAEVLGETARMLGEKISALTASGKISTESKVVFVDDGSRDTTWELIEKLGANNIFAGIKLSRNCGHQYALLSGLMRVRMLADVVVSIDADMQDDINAIDKMLDEYFSGRDIVYGVRSSRDKDRFFKRFTAEGYYKLLSALGCDIVFNHADFRLMSARALDALSEYGERDVFLRGLVPLLGYKTARVEYERGERLAGKSKYPLKRMLSLASDGIASLSLRPLRLITVTGAVMLFLTGLLLVYSLITLFMGHTFLNWKIILVSIWGVGGIITLSLGLVGEYAGRAYMEAKRRPRYNIEKTMGI